MVLYDSVRREGRSREGSSVDEGNGDGSSKTTNVFTESGGRRNLRTIKIN